MMHNAKWFPTKQQSLKTYKTKTVRSEKKLDKFTIIIRDFSTSLSVYTNSRQKINKDIKNLNNRINRSSQCLYNVLPKHSRMHIFQAYREYPPEQTDYILYPRIHLQFKIETKELILLHHGLKLEINNRKTMEKSLNL